MIQEFHRPQTLEEALKIKEQYGDRAFFLSGGTEINRIDFPYQPEQIISLEGLTLNTITITDEEIVLGAGCTLQQLIEEEGAPAVLKDICRKIINRNIRHIATLGGNLASQKPWSDLPPVLMVLEGHLNLATSEKTESLSVAEYIQAPPEGILTKIRIPRKPKRFAGVRKHSRSANEPSVLTAAASLVKDPEGVGEVRIAIKGVAKKILALREVEERLNGHPLPPQEELEKMVSEELNPPSDFKGSAEFKKYLAGTMIASILHTAYREEEE